MYTLKIVEVQCTKRSQFQGFFEWSVIVRVLALQLEQLQANLIATITFTIDENLISNPTDNTFNSVHLFISQNYSYSCIHFLPRQLVFISVT